MKEKTEIKWDEYGNPIVYPEQEEEKDPLDEHDEHDEGQPPQEDEQH